MEFSYKEFDGKHYPVIPVTLISESREAHTDALIDSGSSLSLFNIRVADRIGVPYKAGRPVTITTINGQLQAYRHLMSLKVGDIRFQCPIAFAADFKPTFNILGRMGFFETFDVLFRERCKQLSLNQ